MLIQFSVKNFMSFKEKVEFSMEAGSSNENLDNVNEFKDLTERILKSSAIYGANASGKTSLYKALTAAIIMVRRSNIRQPEEKLFEMKPFKFDVKTINEPCEFEFIFVSENIKYAYGFKADINKVYEEYLYQYLTAKPSLIFERTEINNYKFSQADESKLRNLSLQNLENKLFLATATTWNYEKTKNAYMWFAKKIDTYMEFMTLSDLVVEKYSNDNDESQRKFTIDLLKQADIGTIKDYIFESKDITSNNIVAMMNNKPIPGNNIIQKEIKISIKHEIENNEKRDEYSLELADESLGTQGLFFFSPILKDALDNGNVIVIDEIDKSLHPMLVEYIIKLFHNTKINKNGAQLIFNTHDTNLLNLELFRKDQIWFTEKDTKTGSSDLYPLDDFSIRKTENIEKGYLHGRYGAIPFISMEENQWREK